MLMPLSAKTLGTIVSTALTSSLTGTARIDRAGYDYAEIDIILGTSDTPSDMPSVLKLTESDDTVVTNFTAIAAFTGGTAVDSTHGFVIPNADSSNPNIYKLCVDCRARKRYLKVSVTPATNQLCVVHTQLSRAGKGRRPRPSRACCCSWPIDSEPSPFTTGRNPHVRNPGRRATRGEQRHA